MHNTKLPIANTDRARVTLYHNILWSRYKGAVFSELSLLDQQEIDYSFVQIAESGFQQMQLSSVDLRFHTYTYTLLNQGNYEDVGTAKLCAQLVRLVVSDTADLSVLPGYHKLEYWVMLLALKLRRRRVGVFCDSTANDNSRSRIKGVLKRLFFSQCDGFFAYGQRSAEYLQGLGTPIRSIFAGCQAAALPISYSRAAAETARMINLKQQQQPRFLFVGRLVHEKGIDTLLQAFQQFRSLRQTGVLVICGGGELDGDLRSTATTLGIVAYTEFRGPLPDDQLAQEYAAATCTILNSRSEPWGLVVNESLSYGCPAIVSTICGCAPELIDGCNTGLVVSPDDSTELCRAMEQIVDCFDLRTAAQACFELIASFTPTVAALKIHAGCTQLLGSTVTKTVDD